MPRRTLVEQVQDYLAGPKDDTIAQHELVQLMIEVATLRGADLVAFVGLVGAGHLVRVSPSNHRPQTEIALLVSLRNWLLERRLSRRITEARTA